jgi:hypothetical protein
VVIQLVLSKPGLPVLKNLTDASNPPSPDGISFGTMEYSELSSLIANSANPSASLNDGSM